MLSYFYNSYIYEVCHNYFQIIKDSLWNTPRTLTYSSHLATTKQYQSIQMNPAFVPPVYHLKPKVNHKKLETILSSIPNIHFSDVPTGKDEKSNIEISRSGTIPKFTLKPIEYSFLLSVNLLFKNLLMVKVGIFVA